MAGSWGCGMEPGTKPQLSHQLTFILICEWSGQPKSSAHPGTCPSRHRGCELGSQSDHEPRNGPVHHDATPCGWSSLPRLVEEPASPTHQTELPLSPNASCSEGAEPQAARALAAICPSAHC